ncbi:MAG: alpha-L-fucosidase [Bacteroidaceae bacterium]|nr:alpha-L-fucosidase [Bacteroidaceae bacterium]
MKKHYLSLVCAALLGLPLAVSAQGSFGLVEQTLPNPTNEPREVFPVPSERQMKWQETEFYAFFHYGMNTYTGLEWGNGDEAVNTFAPTAQPDPEQWLRLCKAAEMKGGIAVVKHHDGFCLWPTETTDHHCQNSSNAFARQTNIPRDFAAAAKKLGMKYGFYVSPWDRNSAYYGTDRYVTDVFLRQCFELSQYGTDQFEMWFDGANGGSGYYGGANTTRSIDASYYYDIPNLRDSVHRVCPDIILWGVGGEARWCGTESGYTNETTWSMGSGLSGSETEWKWMPSESDAKATSAGWFYHDGETTKDSETLFKMYLETVGRNATLILNFPPNKAGRLTDADSTQLYALGEKLRTRFGTDLAKTATIRATQTRSGGAYNVTNLVDGDKNTYWATDDGQTSAAITLTWDEPQTVRYVMLQEFIRKGQRIKSFTIETTEDGTSWTQRASNIQTTTVGYKRIIPLNGSTSASYGAGYQVRGLRIRITDSRACPLLHTLSVF